MRDPVPASRAAEMRNPAPAVAAAEMRDPVPQPEPPKLDNSSTQFFWSSLKETNLPFISAKTALGLVFAAAEETAATADRDEDQGHHHANGRGHAVVGRGLLSHQLPTRQIYANNEIIIANINKQQI